MKKIFALLFTIIVLSLSAMCAHLDPVRWYMMPINVYMPNNPKSGLMQKAFLELQNNSNNTLKFRFVQVKDRAQITVAFVAQCNHDNAVGLTYQGTKRHAFQKNSIKIGILNPKTNKPYSDKELYIIMLHEAGHAIGMKHTTDPKDIMYPRLNNQQESLTENDIKQIKNLYAY